MQPYFNPTRSNMEDNLNCFENKDNLIFLKMEDDLNIFVNGRQPQLVFKWKMASIFLIMDDDLGK